MFVFNEDCRIAARRVWMENRIVDRIGFSSGRQMTDVLVPLSSPIGTCYRRVDLERVRHGLSLFCNDALYPIWWATEVPYPGRIVCRKHTVTILMNRHLHELLVCDCAIKGGFASI